MHLTKSKYLWDQAHPPHKNKYSARVKGESRRRRRRRKEKERSKRKERVSLAKEQEDSSRTSPTAEDRPIRGDGGPRGGLRAPGPAITRHRQTIHKARERGGGKKRGKAERYLGWWFFGWVCDASARGVLGGVLPPPKCSLNYSLERHGMERVRGKWSHEGRRQGKEEWTSDTEASSLPVALSSSLSSSLFPSLSLPARINFRPTKSRMERKVSALESLLEEIFAGDTLERWYMCTSRLRYFIDREEIKDQRELKFRKGCDKIGK